LPSHPLRAFLLSEASRKLANLGKGDGLDGGATEWQGN